MSCISILPCDPNALTADRFVKNEYPTGDIDCNNSVFSTLHPYESDTLEIFIDGNRLDKTHYVELGDNQTFELVYDPTDQNGLKTPPMTGERLTVNYIKQTDADSFCLTTL